MAVQSFKKVIDIPPQPARKEEVQMARCTDCGETWRVYEDRCSFCVRCTYGDKPYH